MHNNFIRWTASPSYTVDVPIYTTSAGARIEHNTVLSEGVYQPAGSPVAIEVRYDSTTGVVVRNNLLDGLVHPRNGATPSQSNNATHATGSWFQDAEAGDLRLGSDGLVEVGRSHLRQELLDHGPDPHDLGRL